MKGGVVGKLLYSTMKNCHNFGIITNPNATITQTAHGATGAIIGLYLIYFKTILITILIIIVKNRKLSKFNCFKMWSVSRINYCSM